MEDINRVQGDSFPKRDDGFLVNLETGFRYRDKEVVIGPFSFNGWIFLAGLAVLCVLIRYC